MFIQTHNDTQFGSLPVKTIFLFINSLDNPPTLIIFILFVSHYTDRWYYLDKNPIQPPPSLTKIRSRKRTVRDLLNPELLNQELEGEKSYKRNIRELNKEPKSPSSYVTTESWRFTHTSWSLNCKGGHTNHPQSSKSIDFVESYILGVGVWWCVCVGRGKN